MNRIFAVEDVIGERTFQSTSNGVQVEVSAYGLTLTDGKNSLFAEGYRDRSEVMKKLNLQKGDIVQLNLSTSVRKNTKENVVFYGNNVTIEGIQVLLRNSF